MPSYARKKMCSECPFRANAAKGWLGPWTPEDLASIVRHDVHFICHPEIDRLQDEGMTTEEIAEEGQQCVGALRYANALCKLSHDPERAKFQQELKEVPDVAVIPANKLVEYHTLQKKEESEPCPKKRTKPKK